MPGLDGFQICRTVKADPETSSTVVIAMTGFYSPEIETRILECGAIKCFAKPMDPTTVSSYIDSVFEQQNSKSRRRRPARA
jgi:putative two-component system response regulator